MRLAHLWSAAALLCVAQALSIERDDCSKIKCNAPGCDGTNSFLSDGRGQCFDGPCNGLPCLTVCPSADISCNQFGCNALYGGNDTAWTCSSGGYAGCRCQNSCPTSLPTCSDSACQGSSNLGDQYGICGAPLLSDCACINNCPSTPSACSSDDCQGANNPSGADSTCTAGSQLGCSCKSSCPAVVSCSNAQCQGYSNRNNASASYCLAGTYAGCRCVSTCPIAALNGVLGMNSCTAHGCQGINNLKGGEFCTAGDFRGCHCTSACPSTALACSDVNNCNGFEGLCTQGDARGCNCTGSSPTRKRSPDRVGPAPRAVTTVLDGPDSNIPSSYYICGPRNRESQPSAQGTRAYPRQQLQQAIDQGFQLSIGEERLTAGNGRSYPQRFYVRGPNAANFRIPNNDRRINVDRLVEFPIIRDGNGDYVPFTAGGDQGPDRVVFDGLTGYFAGVFTHRGEAGNNFHRAPAHNQEVNVPDIDFGPTILATDPITWFAGLANTGPGSLPLKRTPTYPPANFPTTLAGCPSNSRNGQCYCYNTVTVEGWYPRDAALQAIDQACSDWNGQTVGRGINNPLDTTKKITVDNVAWSIEMSVWDTLLAGGTPPSTVNQQNCVTALRSAMDNCQTNTQTQKIGGEFQFWIEGVGSQQYIIHPGAGNPAPPSGNSNDTDFDQ